MFYNPRGFWDPLFALFQHTVDERLTPAAFMDAWATVERVEDILPALLAQQPGEPMLEADVRRLS